MIVEEGSRHQFLMTNISKRAIRTTVEDEQEAFVRWVTRQPFHEETKINGVYAFEEGIADLEIADLEYDSEEDV